MFVWLLLYGHIRGLLRLYGYIVACGRINGAHQGNDRGYIGACEILYIELA